MSKLFSHFLCPKTCVQNINYKTEIFLLALFNINNKKCEILLQRATVHVVKYGMSVSPYMWRAS